MIAKTLFLQAFDDFKKRIRGYKGKEFISFHEGVSQEWEGYKIPLQQKAKSLLNIGQWNKQSIGHGVILNNVIRAIEIDNKTDVVNNLVNWQNRWGHANRPHHALIDAKTDRKSCEKIESTLFNLYTNQADDIQSFERLVEAAGKRYDLLGYLFFVKDPNIYMPIRPTHFDNAFARLGVDFRASQKCGWVNYIEYNNILKEVQASLIEHAKIKDARLIDAHSFCWMLANLPFDEKIEQGKPHKDKGKLLSSRDIEIIRMVKQVEETVKQSGQVSEQTKKIKFSVSAMELEAIIRDLLNKQDDKCNLTGIPLQYHKVNDEQLRASLDRIDSDGHYEPRNLQVVCKFVNFWKRDTVNSEFQRLLSLVRGQED